ncbi:P-loop containing nucleoside triphosphate hydrolase protein [Aspergillus saccharolyticus JOP 1030-1]|uniref:P-loop containing nucleoside triphosphate hydrolase protein n=1 Tax=Aspergillus saccharolyticus JOP 1030-1 TaxID=1450539 RepID=A0A318ZRL2_9EURO|nr:P-loop containing nucleoside triphosphate hydrolase protein [Aspergillus saccharolyticus JOP 1030-1]PYH42728.1 P-loop containing nucleoside triphosphate hydrolase protein [Aspergillus saccharolyticus JOP 1030-1]
MEQGQAAHDELVSQFCAMSGTDASAAQEYLTANGWDLEAAVTEFFAEQDEAMQGAETGPVAGRSLGGSSSQSPSTTPQASSSRKGGPKKRFATLGDFASGAGESSEEDDSVNQDFFAGGEKSGLAVQNPDDIKKKIIEKAKRTQLPPSDEPSRQSHFTGTARTLGGDDAPSRIIEAPSAPATQVPQRVQRTLHFWADGFSVDDGELYRSDDPRNAEILEGIRQGRAPLSIMNVQSGQEVDVEINQHEEKYVKPKPKYKPFSGQGQRLGSPTPGVPTAVSAPTQAPAAAPSQTSEQSKPNIDESQPIITLQIRLGDGTRLTSRFNTTHTIGDVYEFVSASSPASQSRPWVLMTTFPSKDLTDKSAVLGDMADFKRGGVVVLSGKGGVGKSSVTLQLALALSLQGKSVGILDIDLTGPSIPRLVGLEDAKITQAPGGWLPVPVHSAVEATTTPSDQQPQPQPQSQEQQEQQETQPSTSHTSSPIPRGALHCMSLGFLLRSRSDAVIWRGPKKTAMIRQFLSDVLWGETDYLLIDTPPGTSDEHIALAEQLLTLCMTSPPAAADASAGKMPRLAGAVLVTTPQAIATSDVRKEVNFCVKTNIPTLGVIENMSGYTCPCCGEVTNLFSSGGGEVMAREMGVRFLGSVPVDVGFGALVEGKGIGDEGEGTSDDDEEEEEEEEEEDDRLLVERYREGWSYARFEGFAKTLISETEGSSDA